MVRWTSRKTDQTFIADAHRRRFRRLAAFSTNSQTSVMTHKTTSRTSPTRRSFSSRLTPRFPLAPLAVSVMLALGAVASGAQAAEDRFTNVTPHNEKPAKPTVHTNDGKVWQQQSENWIDVHETTIRKVFQSEVVYGTRGDMQNNDIDSGAVLSLSYQPRTGSDVDGRYLRPAAFEESTIHWIAPKTTLFQRLKEPTTQNLDYTGVGLELSASIPSGSITEKRIFNVVMDSELDSDVKGLPRYKSSPEAGIFVGGTENPSLLFKGSMR